MMDGEGHPEHFKQHHQDLEKAVVVVEAVKTRISKLTPVAQLPDKLLSKIFLILANSQKSSWELLSAVFLKRHPRPSRLHWIIVSHVCQAWRRVALGSPALWRRVTFSLGRQWAKCMLTRAGQIPLSITVRPMDLIFAPEIAHRISSRLPQIRELDVAAGKPVLERLVDILTEPAPVLQKLSLTSQSENNFGSVDEVVNLPPTLFQGEIPDLLYLSLRNIFVPWSSSLFNNIRTLSIMLPVFQHALDQELDHVPKLISDRQWHSESKVLISALKNMPALESLTIHGALPYTEEDILDGDPRFLPRIEMPRLSHLDLKGSLDGIAVVLAILILPLDVNMRFAGYTGHDGRRVDITILLSKIAQKLTPATRQSSCIPFTTLHITNQFPSITLRGQVQPKVSRSPALEFQLMDSRFYGSTDTALQYMFHMIELRAVQFLQIANFEIEEMNAMKWNDLFGQCGYVPLPLDYDIPIRDVRIDGTSFESFCGFMARGLPKPYPALVMPLNLPRLHTLVVYSIPSSVFPRLKIYLPRVLKNRKDASAPLHKLVFERFPPSAFSNDFLDSLKAIVPEVVVQDSVHNWPIEY